MNQSILEITKLTRRFGEMRAVDGVDLQVERGAITGLIGPNGAGKSTLFGVVAGEHAPSEGEIRFDGKRISGLSPDRIFRAGLARTFQIPRPFPKMTVLENVMLTPMRQSGERFWNNWFSPGAVSSQERQIREKAMEVLGFTGLGAKVHDLAGVLSGGQQKLLGLAQVMMVDPQLILLDEPAAGVNPTLLESLVEKIVAINRRGVAFLIVEHNMDMVMAMSSSIVVMAQGRIIAQGRPDVVRNDQRVIDAYLGDASAEATA